MPWKFQVVLRKNKTFPSVTAAYTMIALKEEAMHGLTDNDTGKVICGLCQKK